MRITIRPAQGFEATYPMVFKKTDQETIRVKATSTNLLTGEVQHYFKEMRWCVAQQ